MAIWPDDDRLMEEELIVAGRTVKMDKEMLNIPKGAWNRTTSPL
jgi:hypothetical protein